MGEAYPMETVDRAQELYCLDELTLEETARTVGVAASTVKRWSTEYGWAEKRRGIRQARLDIKEKTVRLRADLLRRCLETKDGKNPLNLFAVAKLQEADLKTAEFELKARGAAASGGGEGLREIKTAEDAVDALEEAVSLRLNAMLANPGQISFAAVQDVKKALDLVKDLRAQAKPAETARRRGLTPEGAEQIRREILGITS